MHKHIHDRKRGFSLVELSIVIVIISLLVGALAGMRSYTKNAALTSMMNETKFYTSAFNQFQTRYNAPPGDYCSGTCGTEAAPSASNVWAVAYNGDGNGLIYAGSTAFPKERYYAFQHLALAGFIQGRFTGAANATGGASISKGTDATYYGNVPGSTAMNDVAFLFDHPSATDGVMSGDSVYFDGLYGNVLRVAGLNSAATTIPDQAFLTPKQTLQIDEKYDDGAPGTGNVTVPQSATLANCATSSTVYNVTTAPDSKACYLILRMQ